MPEALLSLTWLSTELEIDNHLMYKTAPCAAPGPVPHPEKLTKCAPVSAILKFRVQYRRNTTRRGSDGRRPVRFQPPAPRVGCPQTQMWAGIRLNSDLSKCSLEVPQESFSCVVSLKCLVIILSQARDASNKWIKISNKSNMTNFNLGYQYIQRKNTDKWQPVSKTQVNGTINTSLHVLEAT